jgi:predicted nucleotidyltransferase
MTTDLETASSMIQETLLRELGDEVELIIHYGSHFRGDAHKHSDLDLIYIPTHEETWNHVTVLVDDTLIDLFPFHWSRFEDVAEFNHVFCTILLNSEILYQRDAEAARRFLALRDRLRALLAPEAFPDMLRKAQEIFQKTGYAYYLLHQQAANQHQLAAMYHAQEILKTILHALAVLNQSCIDTRKLDQVLALPKQPPDFAEMVHIIMTTADPAQLLQATEDLMNVTRDLLLAEQQKAAGGEPNFPEVFSATYPEFKAGIQHLMLAGEQENPFTFELMSLYHELMIHMAWASTGIGYSNFNSIAEYEQDLAALGFPDLLPTIAAGDFAGLAEQCRLFDQRLQEYLTQKGVSLNSFATLDGLQKYLENRST